LLAGAGILAVAGVLYLLACWVPGGYRPARLSRQDREAAMQHFRRWQVMEFSNVGQENKPFTWSISQDDLNRYLGSMDEIAVEGGAKPGSVDAVMRKVAVTEPAVELDNGQVRLMVHSTRYEKIVSAALAFEFTPGGKLRVSLAGVKVGQLPVPSSLVREQVEKLKQALARPLRSQAGTEGPLAGGSSSADLGKLLGRVIAAIDGEPIDAELSWRIHTRKRVRIDRIDIEGGVLRLHVVPVVKAGEKP
jgi:hypothetical protein